jgi:hypothetical protein
MNDAFRCGGVPDVTDLLADPIKHLYDFVEKNGCHQDAIS